MKTSFFASARFLPMGGWTIASLWLCACGASSPASSSAPPVGQPTGQVVLYRYESLDEREVSSSALHGRATLVAFLTTYGGPSLLQARFVKKVLQEHVPRIHAAGVFLELPENRPLIRIFRDSLGLSYPTAIADPATISGQGPFVGVHVVPSVVVLNASGQETWRKIGLASPEELHRALKQAQGDADGDTAQSR